MKKMLVAKQYLNQKVLKAQCLEEPEDFAQKLESYKRTQEAFKQLNLTTKSIFNYVVEGNVATNPNEEIMVKLGEARSLKKAYKAEKRYYETRLSNVASLEKNPKATPEKKAAATSERDSAQAVYDGSKEKFQSAVLELEMERDEIYDATIEKACQVLSALPAPWQGYSSTASYGGGGYGGGETKQSDDSSSDGGNLPEQRGSLEDFGGDQGGAPSEPAYEPEEEIDPDQLESPPIPATQPDPVDDDSDSTD